MISFRLRLVLDAKTQGAQTTPPKHDKAKADTCACTCKHYIHVSTQGHVCARLFMCICTCISACISVRIYRCVGVYTHIHAAYMCAHKWIDVTHNKTMQSLLPFHLLVHPVCLRISLSSPRGRSCPGASGRHHLWSWQWPNRFKKGIPCKEHLGLI